MARRIQKSTCMIVENLNRSTTTVMDQFTDQENQYEHMILKNVVTYVFYDEDDKKTCYDISLVVSKGVDPIRLANFANDITMTQLKKKVYQTKISEKLTFFEEEDGLSNVIKATASGYLRESKRVRSDLAVELCRVVKLKAQNTQDRKNAQSCAYYITDLIFERAKYNYFY